MSTPEKKTYQRRLWHRYARTKTALTIVGAMGLLIGLGICFAPSLSGNTSAQLVGCGYMLAGGLLLVARLLLSGLQDFRNRSEHRHEKRKRSGVVLIVVLVMTAILTGLTLHTQALASASLKLSVIRAEHDQLNNAAIDATWSAIHTFLDKTTETSQLIADELPAIGYTLPNDVTVEARISRAGSATAAPGSEAPELYQIETVSSRGDREKTIRCLFAYNNSGKATIHRWLESGAAR